MQPVLIIKQAVKDTTKINTSYNGEITEENLDEKRHRADAGQEVQRVAGLCEQCAEREGRQPDGTQYQSHRREGIRRCGHI